ncbi:prepilin-type N-terminal cleavage/methylation domain-containing protein [Ralstonia sp. UBA689]|uniref:prepilin-type N-terminal cleavage/methylation domain-containing protein n=1 Tax=Ralstonia sp. UBA689 TaxID=1947373 RepID=UPI0025D1E769|nr:prepilin-type N-terminal cleavage/methylation domain-containing protein [Ralstonia sp. UBA689]
MRQPTAFTLIELLVVLAVVAVLTMTATQAWSSHRDSAQRTVARAALVAAMASLERQHAHKGKYDVSGKLPEHAPGYQIQANPCSDRTLAHCVEVAAQPMRPGTSCGTLVLRSTGERFTQIGAARQPASPACWP